MFERRFRDIKKVRYICQAKKSVRFQFIENNRSKHKITQMCRLLEVSKQGYYDWRKRPKSRLALRHEYLTQEIKKTFKKHHGRYGSPRIAQELYDNGIETNKRVVARLMRDNNLIAKGYHRRKASYGKPKDIETIVKENLLFRNFDS